MLVMLQMPALSKSLYASDMYNSHALLSQAGTFLQVPDADEHVNHMHVSASAGIFFALTAVKYLSDVV